MQNRQREEFASLLSDIYPDLETNHERVKNNEAPKCLEKSLFFWQHNSEEKKERSVTNTEEAERAVNLALFLVQQGYEPSKITILAMYRGQRNLILKSMERQVKKYIDCFPKKSQILLQPKPQERIIETKNRGKRKIIKTEMIFEDTEVKINTVDMYQGDENDIVIVSLVRSNKNGDIGFVKEMNRRCVAQSRARCGLYFIGDTKMFWSHPTWRCMLKKLNDMDCVGENIGIICNKHPEVPHKVKDGNAMCLSQLKNFCKQPCGAHMDCTEHLCEEKCQVNHLHSGCKVRVAFTHDKCKHEDTKLCSEDSSYKKCIVSTEFIFKGCGHQSKKKCWEPVNTIPCLVKGSVELPCKHTTSKACYKNIASIKCKEECYRKRECGHSCHGDHKCLKHDQTECEDCKRLETERRKRRRAEERKQRDENKAQVKKEIERLRNNKNALGKIWCEEVLNEGESITLHSDFEDKVKKYVRAAAPYYPVITKIEEVFNAEQEIRFRECSLKLKKTQLSPALFAYSTAAEDWEDDILKIKVNGFTLPPKGKEVYDGICLTSHSPQVISPISNEGNRQHRLLMCQVYLGKAMDLQKSSNEKNITEKYDSLVIPRDNEYKKSYDEFVLFKAKQILAKYVVTYKLMESVSKEIVFEGYFNSSKKIILPKRQADNDDVLQTHFSFVESRFLRMMNRRNPSPLSSKEITQIEFYINPQLEAHFKKKCEEFQKKYPGQIEESTPIYGFHGTKTDSVVEAIMNENFQPSKSGKFGAGVYFSEQPNYTFGYGGENHLIMAQILPGKVLECKYSGMSNRKCETGFDSHGGFKQSDDTFHEIVIFNSDQILPMYVLHFK